MRSQFDDRKIYSGFSGAQQRVLALLFGSVVRNETTAQSDTEDSVIRNFRITVPARAGMNRSDENFYALFVDVPRARGLKRDISRCTAAPPVSRAACAEMNCLPQCVFC